MSDYQIDADLPISYFIEPDGDFIPKRPIKVLDRYVNFYTDFAFKKLFGSEINKDLPISFLNALFDGKERIVDITYLNAEQLGSQEYDRRGIYDVFCKNEKGEFFIVEMQRESQDFFKDRSIFYSTFPLRDQAVRGGWDYQLKAVYTIAFLNFKLPDYEKDSDYRHEIKLMDTEKKTVFYEKLTFVYLELPKFIKQESELESLFDKWMYAIKNLQALNDRPQALQERIFEHFFEVAEIAKYNEKERFAYRESLKNYWDWYSITKTAIRKGMEKGMAEGMEKGLEKGVAKGREEEKRTLAKAMLDMKKISMSDIVAITGLSAEEIELL